MKQRNLLKGRVKRLLKDQKDMGQVSESAVFACSSAVQVFVKDIASKMQKEAVEGIGLTPIELKKSILASTELRFLHEKVTAIDESDAKYHKPARGSKKRALTPTAKKSTAKKPRTKKTEKVARTTSSTAKKTERISDGRIRSDAAAVTVKPVSLISNARALNVEEDDDYDESESDS